MNKRVLSIVAIVFALIAAAGLAFGQQLTNTIDKPSAGSGIEGWMIGIAVLAVLTFAGFVFLYRRNPAKATQLAGDARTDIQAILNAIHDAVAAVANKTPVPAPPVVPMIQPAGKVGQPGLFSVEVTGQRDADIPTIMAAYLGPQA